MDKCMDPHPPLKHRRRERPNSSSSPIHRTESGAAVESELVLAETKQEAGLPDGRVSSQDDPVSFLRRQVAQVRVLVLGLWTPQTDEGVRRPSSAIYASSF